MQRKMAIVWIIVEVNLVLWLIAFGQVAPGLDATGSFRTWLHGSGTVNRASILIGFLFAALAQHWAYYRLTTRIKRSTQQGETMT
jgi:hypothetical protein